MDKYQEAINKIKHITENACNCPDPFTYSETTEIINQCNTLQELVDQNKSLTLEECIKEWEKREWIQRENTKGLYFSKYNEEEISFAYILFDLEDKTFYAELDIDLETSELLHKTLKALNIKDKEVNKNNK